MKKLITFVFLCVATIINAQVPSNANYKATALPTPTTTTGYQVLLFNTSLQTQAKIDVSNLLSAATNYWGSDGTFIYPSPNKVVKIDNSLYLGDGADAGFNVINTYGDGFYFADDSGSPLTMLSFKRGQIVLYNAGSKTTTIDNSELTANVTYKFRNTAASTKYLFTESGTETGHPIQGDIEMADDRSLIYKNGTEFGNIGFSSDGNAYMKYEDSSTSENANVVVSKFGVRQTAGQAYQGQTILSGSQLSVSSDDPGSPGIHGEQYFGDNANGNDFVQLDKVSEMITSGATLQAVTDAGNVTTNTIQVAELNITDPISESYANISSSDGELRIKNASDGATMAVFDPDGTLALANNVNGYSFNILGLSSFTGSRTMTWPNESGAPAIVRTAITNGDTTGSPNGNVLFSALAAKQPLDSDLTAIAGLTTDSFGRGGLTQTSAGNFRTYIGAGTGSGTVTGGTGSQGVSVTGTTNLAVGLGDITPTSMAVTGTGGGGYVGLIPQSSTPSTPASGVKLYARSTGAFSWIGTNGFSRTITGTGLTGDRTWSGPDADGTIVLNDNTATFTNKSLSGSTNTFTNIPAATALTGVVPSANGGAGTINGLLKANGSGTTSAATSGTDIQSINANTILTSGNLNLVSSITAATTNGFSFSSNMLTSGATTLTIGTTITGLIKGTGAGTPAVAATAGTDYITPTGTETMSNKTFTAPVLGTPASGNLSNCTALPIATGISGLGTGIATWLATPSSANLATALTDETGTGVAVFGTSPTFSTGIAISTGGTIMNASAGTRFTLNVGGSAASATASRNLADAITAFTVNNANASSTGAIMDFQAAGSTVASVQRSGKITAVAGTASTDVVVLSQLTGAFKAGSFSATGTATTTFTVTIGVTEANTAYKVNVTPTSALALGGYVTNKTTTTFDYVVPAATGTVSLDFAAFP